MRKLSLTTILVAFATAASPAFAQNKRTMPDANGSLDGLIARHAAANNIPEDLVRRVIKRESGGNPRAVSKGNFGLMQIKLATARGLGYRGTAAGLLDADTNMTYAVKYLAGAYRVANGNTNRAVHYYAAGYYYAAKNKGIPMLSSAQASDSFGGPSNIKFGSDQKLRAFYNRGMTSWSNAYPRPDSY
jgi:Soluble lytic murein transglycosylase and related regulatory proteins (some contain LysM/invasin domains)